MTEETFDGSGEGIELALSGDTIRKRHIATRASNRRSIIVLVVGDVDFEGYSIGLDDHSLQLLDLDSGEVSSISLKHIVAITDGKLFAKLTPEEKSTVDRRTGSFRKISQDWLVANWPTVYDRRDDDDGYSQNRQRVSRALYVRPPQVRHSQPEESRLEPEGKESSRDVDSQVRE